MRWLSSFVLLLVISASVLGACGTPDTASITTQSTTTTVSSTLVSITPERATAVSTVPTVAYKAEPEPDFAFVLDESLCGLGVLNTFNNTFAKNMFGDPPITVTLTLTQAEISQIYRKMVDIDFWSYPETFAIPIPTNAPYTMVEPSQTYDFNVRDGGQAKAVHWNDSIVEPTSVQADNLRELARLIERIIMARPEVNQLPVTSGGCL